jgi:hypothetical protein
MELKPSQSITYSAPWHKPCVNIVDRAFIPQTMSSGHTRGLPPSESVTRLYTDGGKMTIRLIKLPPAPLIDGYDLSAYRSAIVGGVYDADRALAQYLIAAGYAVPEMPPAKVDDRRTRRPRSR